jgi:hypothetical protein
LLYLQELYREENPLSAQRIIAGIATVALLLMGCATTTGAPYSATFRAKAAHLDLQKASVAVIDPEVVGAPGHEQPYKMVFVAAMQSSGKRVIRLAANPKTAVDTLGGRNLSSRMFEAAAAGQPSIDAVDCAQFENAVINATATHQLPYMPQYVMLTRIEVDRPSDKRIRYHVTAALYDLRRHRIFAATRFHRETAPSVLLAEVGNIGAQLLAALVSA